MEQKVPVIEFPLRGEWKAFHTPGHDRFAFDFAAISGKRRQLLATSLWRYLFFHLPVEQSYSWSKPVFSPGNGQIVQVQDGWPDRLELNLPRDLLRLLFTRPHIEHDDIRPFAGNYIIIQLADAFAFLAHLRQGSIKVTIGQPVLVGDLLGEVGYSGFTLAPHLHFQIMDTANATTAQILRFRIPYYERWTGTGWEVIANNVLTKGELIRLKKE